MTTTKKLFTPLSDVSPNTKKTMLWFHLSFFILAWAFLVPEKSFFPNLGNVLSGWKELWMNGLFYHIVATLKLCGTATLISILFSCTLAYLSTVPVFAPIGFIATKLRYNPIQGFTLFLTIMSGGGRNLQITLLVIFMSFYFTNSLIAMINDIPEEDFIRRKAQKMNNWQILWKVVILDRLDYLVEAIRQNLSITFMMIVSVEAMDKSQGGLGAMLVDTNRALNFPKIFALQLTIFITGILLDEILKAVFKSFPANKKNR